MADSKENYKMGVKGLNCLTLTIADYFHDVTTFILRTRLGMMKTVFNLLRCARPKILAVYLTTVSLKRNHSAVTYITHAARTAR